MQRHRATIQDSGTRATRRRWAWMRRAWLAGAMALIAGSVASAASAQQLAQGSGVKFLRIATGSTSGTYFPIGTMIASIISNPQGSRPCDRGGSCGVPGLIAAAKTTSGSVENIEAIGRGEIESALVQADIAYSAFHGSDSFKGKKEGGKLRAIAALYREAIHLVVRADAPMKTVKDLKGRSVSLGDKGSGTMVDAQILLKAYGLGEKAIKPVYAQPGPSIDKLAAGEIDALFFIAGPPTAAITELARRQPVRLIPIEGAPAEKVTAAYPFFTAGAIPADTYDGLPETPTLTVGALWVVSSEVEEELVYQMTRALWHEAARPALERGHPLARQIQLETALDGVAIPLHPGAMRYYEEVGKQPARLPAAGKTN
ncbi:TAXI family TRAP transporter solute-binding subunit [Oceanibaculum pacificum]|uniref:Immunogenic protein n=1 Tax=Oceanibaculum pacificum TaxID=580166 RepID=A0A154W3Z1_9PROT|nr:TAXI family TRAP transporter solute-binding subunit [Oceanibaculum pacificum]KZD08268.1 immunogenic protein [Oceanibaculum pacificum]